MVWVIILIGLMLGFWVFRNHPLAFACLPLLLIVVALSIVFIGDHSNTPKEEDAKKENSARQASTSEGTIDPEVKKESEWNIEHRADPANGRKYVNALSIQSDSGECTISIRRERLNKKYTDIKCKRTTFKPYEDLELRFDNLSEVYSMDLYSHGAGEGVFIPQQQMPLSGHLNYNSFLSFLSNASAIAISTTSLSGKWIRFTLPPMPIEYTDFSGVDYTDK
tara:strand:- start:1401 stop:2066 length:666 start_codon:yes stop_codon:yes gene_type:complete